MLCSRVQPGIVQLFFIIIIISHTLSWPLDFHAASDIFSRIANLEVVLNYQQWFQ